MQPVASFGSFYFGSRARRKAAFLIMLIPVNIPLPHLISSSIWVVQERPPDIGYAAPAAILVSLLFVDFLIVWKIMRAGKGGEKLRVCIAERGAKGGTAPGSQVIM